jgi:ketosteroid isomerase-like protein
LQNNRVKSFKMIRHIRESLFTRWVLLSMVFIIALVNFPGSLPAQNQNKIMEKNKKLIQDGFENWANGTGNFFDLLADNVVWTITGNSPISKTYTSRKQFLEEVIVPLNERLSQMIVPKLSGIYADGDMVIALWDGQAMAKDGIPYNNKYSWYMKIKGEKIVEVVAFFDTLDLATLWKRVTGSD